jgi:hypothetical protein
VIGAGGRHYIWQQTIGVARVFIIKFVLCTPVLADNITNQVNRCDL